MPLERRKTTCSKGHTHLPGNTTGVWRIAKCESVCGFCQKETKTAANLKKHVAIHIKNERLNLTIAEDSNGRARLEMPVVQVGSVSSSPLRSIVDDNEMDTESEPPHLPTTMGPRSPLLPPPYSLRREFSPSAHIAVNQSQLSHPHPSSPTATSSPLISSTLSAHPSPRLTQPTSIFYTQFPSLHSYNLPEPSDIGSPQAIIDDFVGRLLSTDPYKHLRNHHIKTKPAWTAIPASEGFRVLDLCKSLSTASLAAEGTVPCYNRETLFDEEWQAHMKDVHGVFLLWPETWMRRIEVLNLDAFGGDIVAVNEAIMAII